MRRRPILAFALAAFVAATLAACSTGDRARPIPPRPLLTTFDEKRLDGHVAVLVFWASWCDVCHRNVADLANLAAALPAGDTQWVGFTPDESPAAAQAFIDAARPNFDNVLDPGATVARRWHVGEVTSVVILDRSGKERFHHRRVDADALKAIEREVKALNAEPR